MDREQGLELALDFAKRGGLLPVVVQESESKTVLMLGWANEQAWQKTLETGYATFWSTSRNELWVKGLTSGDRLIIVDIRVDCDQDTLLYTVHLEGKGACHTHRADGATRTTCFYRQVNELGRLEFLPTLE